MLWRPPSPKKARSKSHFQDQQPSPYCTDVKARAHIGKSPDPICQAKVTITVRQAIEEENEPPAPPLKVDKRDKCTSTIRNLSHHVLEWKIHSPGHRSSRRDDAQSQAGPPVTTVWQGISLSICLLQSIRKGNCGKARDEALNNDQVLSSVSKMHFIIRYHLYTYIYTYTYTIFTSPHVFERIDFGPRCWVLLSHSCHVQKTENGFIWRHSFFTLRRTTPSHMGSSGVHRFSLGTSWYQLQSRLKSREMNLLQPCFLQEPPECRFCSASQLAGTLEILCLKDCSKLR